MKKNIIFFLILLCFSCVDHYKKYDDNLLVFKEMIENMNNYFQDPNQDFNLSKYYADSFVFHSYPAGNKKGQETKKSDYLDNLKNMKSMGYMLNVVHSIYLPGIKEKTYEVDGSVRVYYGAILSVDTNMVEFSGYMTVNFTGHQISEIWEWADYGGVNNKIKEFNINVE